VTVVGPDTTVFPTSSPQGAARADLVAARNEFSSVQVVVSAGGGALQHPAVALDRPLTGPAGTIPAGQVSIYGERTVTTTIPSKDESGAPGPWPDALVPTVDEFDHQARRAFPDTVPAGQNVVAWIDVLAPRDAAPGAYDGALRVTAAGLDVTVPVHLTVVDFTLPSTSSLRSAFALNWAAPCAALFGDNCQNHPDDGWKTNARFAQLALDNRVTLANPAYQPPIGADDKTGFRTHVVPLLSGTAPTKLPGARLTAIGADVPWLAQWRAEAAADNFTDRTYVQVCDEPSGGQGDPDANWSACHSNAVKVRQGWPGVPVLVTAPIQASDAHHETSNLNILAVELTNMDDKSGEFAGDQRPRYDDFAGRQGNEVWMYVGCNSHGCGDGPSPGAVYDGWAGYTFDEPASEATAMGWLAYVYRASGELYYETSMSLSTAWDNQFVFGGNGEGTLFYPGTPSRIGGTTAVPVESMRLKRIRDGRQAYEYLHYLDLHGKGAAARVVATGLFPRAYDTVRSDAQIQQAHQQLVDLVTGGTGTPGHLALAAPLTIKPGQPTTASFTVVNDGGSTLTVPYVLAGNRDAKSTNLDFPASGQLTLAPGQSYQYRQSRALGAGTYTAWPAYFDGTTWIQLAPPAPYTVP
jgi:hypothetical protein